MIRWTRESAIRAVQLFHLEHGYQPVSNEATKHNNLPSYGVAKRLFGSWNLMIEAAGFRPYPSRSSANAKTRAFRDRNPDWRDKMIKGVRVGAAG